MKAKIAALALLTSAFFSTDVFAAVSSDHYLTCSSGNFKGEISYRKTVDTNKTTFTTRAYRITKSNGQRGGNKANINVSTNYRLYNVIHGEQTKNSPDSMKQDGNWHSYIRDVSIPKPSSRNRFSVKFIFDKSGSDPSCTATHTL